MSERISIKIGAGRAEAVYSDAAAPTLQKMGAVTTTRASHVEPHPTKPGWLADMRPSGGPVLGLNGQHFTQNNPFPLDCVGDLERHFISRLAPFPTRQEALDAERAWLARERGL